MTDLKALRLVASRTSTPFHKLGAPLLLALLAALFEGATCSLLFPALQIINRDAHALGVASDWLTLIGSPYLSPQGIICAVVAAVMTTMVLKTVCGYVSALASAKLTRGVITSLRIELISSLLNSHKDFFDRENASKLQEVLTTHVSSLAHSLSALHGALFALCCIGIYVTLMLTISVPLTCLALLLLPVVGIIVRTVTKKLGATSVNYANEFNAYGTHLGNVLGNIGLVKALAAESTELQRFTHRAQHLGALELSLDKKSHILGPIQELGSVAILSVLLIVFGITADTGNTTLSQQLIFLLVLRRSANMLSSLSAARGAIAGSAGPLREIASLLQAKTAVDTASEISAEGVAFTDLVSGITLQDLTFIHSRDNTVLRNVNASIRAGEFVGIIGPSGSGKSTILALLLRLYAVPPGTIEIDGVDLVRINRQSYLRSIAYVSQDTYLLYGTLRENLLFGLSRPTTDERLLSALDAAHLRDLLHRLPLGLDTMIGDRGVLLSGGERQRLSLARAVLRDAPIWILDEPTSSLDPSTELEVLSVLEPLLRGRTVIMVSHRSVPLRRAQRIYQMRNGTLELLPSDTSSGEETISHPTKA